jgi:2-polyprenyl-6-methoxyphenol hydroxylase-like FAD-dependent oxidoreductase
VTSIEPEADGLRVTLVKDGRTEIVRAAYVIGAEGGHSVTRHSMHERLDGETYRGRYIVADVEAHLPIPPGRGRVVVGPEGFVLFSPLPGKRWLIFVNRDEVDQRDQPPAAAALAALVNSRVGTDIGLADLRWSRSSKCRGDRRPC